MDDSDAMEAEIVAEVVADIDTIAANPPNSTSPTSGNNCEDKESTQDNMTDANGTLSDAKAKSGGAPSAPSEKTATPHGFGRQVISAVGVSPAGHTSEGVGLLLGLGTKSIVHSGSDPNASSAGPGVSLPPPPLTSNAKRGASASSGGGGDGDDKDAASSGGDTSPSKKKRRSSSSSGRKGRGRALPTQQNQATKDAAAAAALRSLASSDDDESRKSGPSKAPPIPPSPPPPPLPTSLVAPQDGGYFRNPASALTNSTAPLLSGIVTDADASTTKSLLVDHSYTDYSVVDPETLRTLDEDQGLSGSGYEWQGLNEDPYPPRHDEQSTTPEEERAIDAALHNLEILAHSDPTFQRERDETVRKLRKLFKGIRPGRRNSGGVIQPFPGKLMEVLDREDIVDVISWLPHGRAFLVKQPKIFTADILPRFFKQSKFMSFTRQLNLWGFKRITRGRDAGAYYHELFLRGRPRLTLRMRRQKIKGTGIKLSPNPEQEPNFYEMARIRPLPRSVNRSDGKSAPLPPMLEPYTGGRRSAGSTSVANPSTSKSATNGKISRSAGGESTYEIDTIGYEPKKKKAAPKNKKATKKATARAASDLTASEASFPSMPPLPPTESVPSASTAAASAAPATVSDASILAAEILRQREQAAANELLLGVQNESSQLERILRLQAMELKQKQDIAIATQGAGLLRDIESAIPGAPTVPPVTIADLQQRLLAAAAALDQPAVQAAVMEEQRRTQLASLLSRGSTSSILNLAAAIETQRAEASAMAAGETAAAAAAAAVGSPPGSPAAKLTAAAAAASSPEAVPAAAPVEAVTTAAPIPEATSEISEV